MSRVEREDQARRNEEARQTNVRTEKQLQEARVKFGQALDQKKTEKNASNQQQVAQQRNAAMGKASNAALLARQGMQAQAKFAAMLNNAGTENLQRTDSEVSVRREDVQEKELSRAEDQVEITREEIREEQRQQDLHFAAVDPDQQGQHSRQGGQGGGQGDQRDQAPATTGVGGAAQAQESGHSANMPRIPEAVLQELVKRVMVGVDQNGLGTFVIQLKNDVLGGATMQITARDGKISAKFTVSDENTGRLLKASEGALSRAFGRRGMQLERLEVDTRPA